ncbi:hypothetical protein [Ferrimonas pelagia]|uniref:Uncharacterized protein n=1 Tax=Ferrimonas pelagia TaxID=1177826 RepID=A0ABP9EAU5_9GAMM
MSKVALVMGVETEWDRAVLVGLYQQLAAQDRLYFVVPDPAFGQAMCRQIQALGSTSKIRAGAAPPKLAFEVLDRSDADAVGDLAQRLRIRHGGLSVLINPLAQPLDKSLSDKCQVREFIRTNNLAASALLQSMLPVLLAEARVVMVASALGCLRQLAQPLQARFDTDGAQFADIDAVMQHYVEAVEQGTAKAEGWPDWLQIPSQVGRVALTRVAAQWLARERPDSNILINAVCPDLHEGKASVDVKDVLWLASRPVGSPSPQGQLVQGRSELPWQ